MEYPSYLIHFNPNHDPKTGRFDFSKEGYKTLKSEYKSDVKDARKEFRKVLKDTGKNKLFQSNESRIEAIALVDKFASKKSLELFNKYIDLNKYKAEMNGKELKKIPMQHYFTELGLDPTILNIPYPTLNMYYTINTKKLGPQVQKYSLQYYQINA